jgi:hypothetical protein
MRVDEAKVAKLSSLLAEAGRAHHEALPGDDPEWARWYATFLKGELGELLGLTPSVDRIVDLLTLAQRRHQAEAADQPWPDHYARVLVELAGEAPAGG